MVIDTYSAGGVVLNSKGQILVVNQASDSWSLPKGHIDEGEDAMQAARREIFEESGIKQLEYIKELGTYRRFRMKHGKMDKTQRKNITMFLFKTTETELRPVDPENPEARWVDKDKVSELLSFAKDREFFERVLGEGLPEFN